MPGRIVLFGATGYTGRLTAEALLARGVRPVLAARSAEKLESLAAELDPSLELEVADGARPESISALVERGDVLVTTVGPFARFGEPALQAALAARATYIDSTGEPAFVRRVFERFGPAGERAGCALLTGFGYDFVAGNLAGALALREADRPAEFVDIGYFVTGRAALGAWSGGTLASLAGAIAEPGFAFRDGHLVSEPNGRHVQSFQQCRVEVAQVVAVVQTRTWRRRGRGKGGPSPRVLRAKRDNLLPTAGGCLPATKAFGSARRFASPPLPPPTRPRCGPYTSRTASPTMGLGWS